MSDPRQNSGILRRRSKLVLRGVRPARSWPVRLLMIAAFLTLCGGTAATVAVVTVYYIYSRGLPEIPRVDEYRPAVLSEVLTDDEVLAGEFYSERRKVVPYERIPKRLVQAFIASEDSSFFDHGGVDVLGTARAAFNTLRKKLGLGGSVQGGSTLTQQTAKAILVTAETLDLDTDQMMVEAEKSVPVITDPAPAEVGRELAAAQREFQQNGFIRLSDNTHTDSPTPEQLRRLATDRARRTAELARQEQVARAFLTIREREQRDAFKRATAKTMERKIREAILARRLEAALTKEEILYLYLNNVYLGHHSYGVQAAAENYFRKDVRDLTLAEMSLIAGLPQAPSRYSPHLNPDAAKKRRAYVLERMVDEGMISEAEQKEANAGEVKVYPVEDVFHEFAPYFVEQVRRDLVSRYGNSMLLNEGLRIHTTMDSERQRAAQDAMFYGLLAVDKRQGFRGPLMKLPKNEWEAFLARGTQALGDAKIEKGRFFVALVKSVDTDGADVQVGPFQGRLPLLGMRWARRLNPEVHYPGALLQSAKSALKPGDVVVVRAVDPDGLVDDEVQTSAPMKKELPAGVQLFRLEQEPELQGAIVSIDPHRQYLVAMVGGYDFDANEYNRAFQACRQPGSSFKPVVYSAAIEKLDWTEATLIVDSPIVFDDTSTELRWKPQNYDEDFQGDVLLRTALVKSMNIPAVKTFQAVGIETMSEWAASLGLSTPINPDLSSALGSSCVYPYELAGVYATFARYGNKRPTYFIRKIEDRFGRTLEDHTAYDDAWASLEDRLAAAYAKLFTSGEQVMSRESGFITVDLLRGVVREGTGAPANKLGKPAAGKTGTTNDSYDAWFAGFTRSLVGVTWVGYDLNPHPLGHFETGGRAALPIWLAYMKRALDGVPQGEFFPPAGAQLVRLSIDNRTGKLAIKGSKDVKDMWFKAGTQPQDATPEKGTVDPNQFMMTDQGL
jgi:penicillin-binding protein 1A